MKTARSGALLGTVKLYVTGAAPGQRVDRRCDLLLPEGRAVRDVMGKSRRPWENVVDTMHAILPNETPKLP